MSPLDDHPKSALELDREEYVQRVIERYRHTPGTTGRWRQNDRRLAAQLYERSVPLYLVNMTLAMAALRRLLRDKAAPTLSPIRSLHYFLPVLEELLQDSPDEDYLLYLEDKLHTLSC